MPDSTRLEKYRQRYAALRPGWEPATARFERQVAAALTADSAVLDLGCGRGGIVERLGPHRGDGPAGRWIGIDPDIASLREHRVANLARACADALRLPFAAETFDIVIASWVLEHLPQPVTTFGEVARVLRPGGAFFILTPNAAHPLPRLSAALAPLHRLQSYAVSLIYGRATADTFPVAYRANTASAIERLATPLGLRAIDMVWVDDPSYFAWNSLSFIAAVVLEMFLPAGHQVHLVGRLRKESPSKSHNTGANDPRR
jgi:SAM-dependent methyltransferase